MLLWSGVNGRLWSLEFPKSKWGDELAWGLGDIRVMDGRATEETIEPAAGFLQKEKREIFIAFSKQIEYHTCGENFYKL